MLKQYCVKLRRANWLLVITLSQCSTDFPTAIAWPPSPFQASGMFFPFSHLWGTWHFQYRLKSEATLLTRFSGTPSVHNTLINTAWRPTSLTTTMINDRKESHSIVSDRMLDRQTSALLFSCGHSRFNLCMPFVFSDWPRQTLTYTYVWRVAGAIAAGHGTEWNKTTIKPSCKQVKK